MNFSLQTVMTSVRFRLIT